MCKCFESYVSLLSFSSFIWIFLCKFHRNAVPIEGNVIALKHNQVGVLYVQLDVCQVFHTKQIFRRNEFYHVIGSLDFLLYLPLLLFWSRVWPTRLCLHLPQVDLILLADLLQHLTAELLIHLLEYLYPTHEFSIILFTLDLAQYVILITRLCIVQTLLTWYNILFYKKLEALFNSHFNIFRHNHCFCFISKQFHFDFIKVFKNLHAIFWKPYTWVNWIIHHF